MKRLCHRSRPTYYPTTMFGLKFSRRSYILSEKFNTVWKAIEFNFEFLEDHKIPVSCFGKSLQFPYRRSSSHVLSTYLQDERILLLFQRSLPQRQGQQCAIYLGLLNHCLIKSDSKDEVGRRQRNTENLEKSS